VQHEPAECGRAAFDSVVRLGITPTPDNFAIWYEYHSGLNPELRHLIDLLLSKPGHCDDQTMAAVHRKFFSHVRERDALRAASDRMQSLLLEVSAAVGEAGDDARQFGVAVRDTSSAFANGSTTLPDLIQRLREEARAMAERSDAIAHHLAGAAERITILERSLDDLRHDAATDSLTRLNNRRSFDARIRDAAGVAMNSGDPLALVMVDIDYFKRVNDSWGHQTGDQVLRLVAGTLTSHTRPEDFAARYGGEEFALILVATPPSAAVEIADRIRRSFEGREIVARGSGRSIGQISISAGVALYEPGERLAQWIERADQALYAAKRAGRNRVLLAPAPPAGGPARTEAAGVA
jgi:diguanylate cyclase